MPKVNLSVPKSAFESRVAFAFKAIAKNDLSKKEIDNAMDIILFGLDGGEPIEVWSITESYCLEGSKVLERTQHRQTKEDAELFLYANVIGFVADNAIKAVNMQELEKLMSDAGFDYIKEQLLEFKTSAKECNDNMKYEILEFSFEEPLNVQKVIFDYVTNLDVITGCHSIELVKKS
ncbi:hypothetical protein [Vibrio sp. D431a]|uniref:hypothetical protein n=1 Tax=Vibrio sp. D431a TaxID=2837388 RepID=UPI00255720E1|nr:hypothetical protein [Vibrio sp. D431a]MDK9793324.1 hypothetical protein [Vibrio sp. D431a]